MRQENNNPRSVERGWQRRLYQQEEDRGMGGTGVKRLPVGDGRGGPSHGGGGGGGGGQPGGGGVTAPQ